MSSARSRVNPSKLGSQAHRGQRAFFIPVALRCCPLVPDGVNLGLMLRRGAPAKRHRGSPIAQGLRGLTGQGRK